MFSSRIDRSQRILRCQGKEPPPRGPSQCYVGKQLFSLQVQLSLNNLPSYRPYLESNNPSTTQGQDVQSRSDTAGAKPVERFRRVQTVQQAESKANSVHHEDTVYEREGVLKTWLPQPLTAGSPALTGPLPRSRWLFVSQHQGWVLSCTRPGTVFCKIFGRTASKSGPPAVGLEVPNRETTDTSEGAERRQTAPPPRPSTSTSAGRADQQ